MKSVSERVNLLADFVIKPCVMPEINLADEILVERARQGDSEAFTELMRRSASTSKRLAVSILRNPDAADDALQEAFSRAWQHVPGFHGYAKFSTWLMRIVVNQCLMVLRRNKRHQPVALDEGSPEEDRASVQLRDPGLGPERLLARQEMISAVRREVGRLPKLLREPLEMRDLEERPIEEIAGKLQLSIPAVKSRLLRARAELRQRLERHMPSDRAVAMS